MQNELLFSSPSKPRRSSRADFCHGKQLPARKPAEEPSRKVPASASSADQSERLIDADSLLSKRTADNGDKFALKQADTW